ncbi:type IX secretion system membrane protein PorP/SprF [Limibacter armeniacum]|uniref:PorP/SprF family type IX secretion system membrane protein n=1 Tax=Limibacter armeniacum TaxID=466084 RepID=UPI002FE5E1CB
MKKLYTVAFFMFMLCSVEVAAQIDVPKSQYVFNNLVINPAYAGSREVLNFTSFTRMQWVGVEGAPVTMQLIGDIGFPSKRIGVGINLAYDQTGVHSDYLASGSFSYKIPIGKDWSLSAGLNIGARYFQSDYDDVLLPVNDPAFNTGTVSVIKPVVGAGLFLQGKSAFAGFSLPKLQDVVVSDVYGVTAYRPVVYIQGGYQFDLRPWFSIVPSALIRVSDTDPMVVDLNLIGVYNNVIWMGVSYQYDQTLGVLTQLQLSKQLRLGYAYETQMGSDINLRSNTHEIVLNLSMNFSKHKEVSPRYF